MLAQLHAHKVTTHFSLLKPFEYAKYELLAFIAAMK
jgi:hypothetical protein